MPGTDPHAAACECSSPCICDRHRMSSHGSACGFAQLKGMCLDWSISGRHPNIVSAVLGQAGMFVCGQIWMIAPGGSMQIPSFDLRHGRRDCKSYSKHRQMVQGAFA